MAHLLHKYHSSALFLGIGMLMLFSFCAPAYASDAPATPTFRSTSPFGINQTIQGATVNINGIHQGTIYKPFSSDHPYADLNPGSGSGGSSDPNDDVGIPGWADTPSEPLPIGDGTIFLLLITAIMITTIAIKQRKQKQIITQTNNNSNNNTTQHMTTRKQTYQSLRQKLFLLLAFVCVAGQVSAEKKTIYFRPSTVGIDNGYLGSWGLTSATTANNVSWAKLSSLARFLVLEKKSNGTFAEHSEYKLAANILPTATNKEAKYSRFIPTELEATSSFAIYRMQNGYSNVEKSINDDGCYNCIPNNEWWNSNGTANKGTMLISMSDLGDCNMVAIREGYWATGRNDDWKGYYFGYYLEEDAHIYFENKNDWTAPTFLRSKDIYAYTHDLTQISGTNLWYCKLAKPTDDVESGIAYTQYAFISNRTTKTTNTTTFKTDIAEGVEDPYLWKRFPHNTDDDTDLARGNRNKHNFDKLKAGKNYTGTITHDKLSGKTNLYIPGASNDAAVSKQTLNSWQDLNKTLNFKIQTSTDLGKTYPESNAGGSFTCQTCSLTSATTASDMYTTTITQATGTSCTSAYTATVTFTAIPKAGYSFIGWYAGTNAESFLSRNLTYTTTKENSNTTITAKFAKGVLKNVRSQTCKYTNGKWKYSDSSTGGTFTMTYNNGETYTHTLDEYKKDILVSADDPATFDAHPNDGYTFIGWYNDGKGPYFDDPFTMLNPAEYNQNVTARFAQLTEQTIKATTFNPNTNTFEPSNIGGTVTTQYIGISGGDPVTETTSTSGVGTYKVIKHISNAEPSSYKVTANAADGYTFIGWYNGNNERIDWMTGNEHNISAGQSYTIVARFVKTELYDKPVTRNFQIQTYNTETKKWVTNTTGGVVNVTYNGDQHVTVDETNPTKISNIIEGSKITMEAAPKENYSFIYWQCQWSRGTNPNCTINALDSTYSINGGTYSNGSYTARFAKLANQTINIQTHKSASNGYQSNADGGSVTISYDYDMTELQVDAQGNKKTVSKIYSEAINDGNPHTYRTMVGRTVTLEVNAQPGYSFLGWYEGESPVSMSNTYTYTASEARDITARFAEGGKTDLTVRAMIWDGSKLANSLDGGSFTMTHSGGIVYTPEDKNDKIIPVSNTPVTFEAAANDDYEFIAWFNSSKGPFFDNPWAMTDPSKRELYDLTVSAAFAHTNYAKKQNINIEGPGTVRANYTYYNTSIKETIFEQNSSFIAWNGTEVTLTANPLAGYEFDGWYDENGSELSENSTYSYDATSAHTITAKFKSAVNKLTVSVLNYNTSYNEFREYEYEYNKVTLKQGSSVLKESYSSFSHEFNDATSVTITATPESDEETGYDFIGWYQNGTKISTEKTINVNVIGLQAISAHFAPKKCFNVRLLPPKGGTYSVKYARESLFNQEGMCYVVHTPYDKEINIYVPYDAKIAVINPKPINGYEYLEFKVFHGNNNNDGTFSIIPPSGKDKYEEVDLPAVIPNFVRTEEQVVYLDISNKDKDSDWADVTTFQCNKRNPANNSVNLEVSFTEKVDEFANIYKITIEAKTFDNIDIIGDNNTKEYTSGRLAIPSTRYNCYKLNAYQSSTGEWVDAWTTLPTQEGDYRLIYIEQEVTSKTEITRTYEFNEGDRIKKVSSGNKTDIVSLHIYNKVSKDNNGNLTGTALNNPEIILQQWDGTTWVDIERHMVFGPLQTDNTSNIRMPGRKNTVQLVVDKGINAIKAEKDNATKDYGSGVWNFYITQENGNVKLELDKTHRYTGDYYIRTTNADGQYNNYTHPGNVMTPSEYAKSNSDYSHYFIRYVDINEDGTPTSQAGKHNQVKFTVATAYTEFLCKELMVNNNRFTDDEYEDDIFVLNDNNNPKLPADASVRFGWDIRTNRLTRAYIANTTIKNNEYLVVEGDNIGTPTGDATYFTDNSNWLYTIDLNATAEAAAKVKAKMNGQYQYFMGSEQSNETLISGNGASTYPIRLLYDFKDDRFTTIYRPKSGTINNDVELSTPLMIEREHNGQATQIVLNTNKITTVEAGQDQFTQPAYAVMTFLESVLADASKTHHEKMFYWISFPFDVCIRDVFGLGDYGKYWIMEEYDGAQRAKSGLAQSNWKYITKKSTILQKNKGYVLCLNYSQILQDQLFKSYGSSDKTLNSGKLSLYFPSNGTLSPRDITGNQRIDVNLEEHYNANTAWNHHNWHIIGVPSFADPEFTKIQQDAPFVYQYWHPGDAYAAVSINEVDFQSMHAYMVQYTGDITWTSVVNTGGSVSKLAAKTDEQADKKVMLRLELQQAGSTIDKTYVQLRNDKGTKGFDMSLDLTKIINAGANIYSIVDNHEMAGNAIPKDETVLPLGVVITAAGSYTFAMPQGTEGMIVELIDYEQGTSTNLLMSEYTITLDKGTFNQRFALRLVPEKVATSVEDITGGSNDDNVRKLLIDGVLYLQKDGAVYDAQGHCVR